MWYEAWGAQAQAVGGMKRLWEYMVHMAQVQSSEHLTEGQLSFQVGGIWVWGRAAKKKWDIWGRFDAPQKVLGKNGENGKIWFFWKKIGKLVKSGNPGLSESGRPGAA